MSFVAGTWGIATGVLFRIGRLRGMARYYGDPLFPFYVRNGAFAMIPCGVAFLLLFVGGLFVPKAESLALVLFLGMPLSVLLAILLTYAPPKWLKPQWMRDGETWDG